MECRPSPPYTLDETGRCETRFICSRIAARQSTDPGVLKEIRDDALGLPDDIRRQAAHGLRMIAAAAAENEAVKAWVESTMNGISYHAWLFVTAALPDVSPWEIAGLIDADGRWFGLRSGADLLRWVKATMRDEPTDEDCEVYAARERVTRRASERLTWAEDE